MRDGGGLLALWAPFADVEAGVVRYPCLYCRSTVGGFIPCCPAAFLFQVRIHESIQRIRGGH
jgi:hypothetical protein